MLKKNKQTSLNLSIVIILVFTLSLVIFFCAPLFSDDSPPFPSQEKENVSLPFSLKIPKINVDAVVLQVGLTPDGAVDVPKGPDEVAWFNLSPYPGKIGSAVIAGHSGYKDNKEAVFDNLYKLEKGDKIYVEDKNGMMTTFVVRESREYNPNVNAGEVFNSNDEKSHLNLITCTGAWNEVERTHSNRLVVFADKEI